MTTINNLTNGIFQVNSSNKVSIDYLDDGGWYKGELAIFSLQGMENLEIGSQEFLQEAANRALSNSELGYVVIQDESDRAYFNDLNNELSWKGQFNGGVCNGEQTFQMQSGDRFAMMLVSNGTVVDIAANPSAEDVLFSFDTFGLESDNCEIETFSVDFTERILISDIFSDLTLVQFNSIFNQNLARQNLMYEILLRI